MTQYKAKGKLMAMLQRDETNSPSLLRASAYVEATADKTEGKLGESSGWWRRPELDGRTIITGL